MGLRAVMSDHALGHIIEGTVERDPLTGRVQIMTVGDDNQAKIVDISDLIAPYEGVEVRLTLVTFSSLAQIEKLVESSGGSNVYGVTPDQLPSVPFNIIRRRN